MRHPFDGINEPQPEARSSRRSVLMRTLAATTGLAATLLGLGRTASARSPQVVHRNGRITTVPLGEEGGLQQRPPRPSTRRLGEEGGGGPVTTFALGEEGGATTYALGEEGGVTTYALGEEGGVTSFALGEEGGVTTRRFREEG